MTMRAAACLLLLAGFYVVVAALIVGFLALAAGLISWSTASAKFAWMALAAAVGLVVTLWKVSRAQRSEPSGVLVERTQAPELWALIDEVSAAARTAGPREIRLVPDLNAGVSEDTRLLGLLGGTRRLVLGIPLLLALDVAQLRAVIGHELGHYSQGHTRLGAVAYRGRQVVGGAATHVTGFSGWVLRGYARLYFAASAAVSRRQELEADAVAVAVGGRESAQQALLEVEVAAAAWSFYSDRYLAEAWELGVAPTDGGFFGGFAHLMTARQDELDRLRASAPPADRSAWDTHPPTADRIAAMERLESSTVVRDERPATSLLPAFPAAAAAVATEFLDVADRERLPWDDIATRIFAARAQRTADLVFRATARLTGGKEASLADVIDLAEAGRFGELVLALGMDPDTGPDEDGDTPVSSVWAALLRCALVSGDARWVHSWESGGTLVGPDDEPAPVEPLAHLGAEGRLDELRAELVTHGVELRSVAIANVVDVHRAEVVDGISNVKVDDDEWHDLLVLTHGLVLIPAPKSTNDAKKRMRHHLESGSAADLAEWFRFIPFEEVASGTVLKTLPARIALTLHDGTTVTLRTRMDSEELRSGASARLVELARKYSPATV